MELIRFGKLDRYELKTLQDDAATYRHKAAAAGIYGGKFKGIDTGIRDCLTYFPTVIDHPKTFNILQSQILQEYYNIGIDITHVSEVQFAQYHPGNWFKMHSDVLPARNDRLRGFSLSVNITNPDEYEGGELIIQTKNGVVTLDKDPGSFVVFPSFLKHQANKVTSGIREAVVCWVHVYTQELEKLKVLYNSTSI